MGKVAPGQPRAQAYEAEVWGKGGSSDLELELGRRVSQVELGGAAVTNNPKISVLHSTKNYFSLCNMLIMGQLECLAPYPPHSEPRLRKALSSWFHYPQGRKKEAWPIVYWLLMFLPRSEMPHLYVYAIGQSRSHVHT